MPLESVIIEGSPCLGPYSHATKCGNLVFVSGQLGMKNGQLGTTVEEQAEFALQNMANVLKAAGSSMDKVAKTQVMLADINDFKKVNDVYAKHFPGVKPARICVQVAKLPANALVEIDAIACTD